MATCYSISSLHALRCAALPLLVAGGLPELASANAPATFVLVDNGVPTAQASISGNWNQGEGVISGQGLAAIIGGKVGVGAGDFLVSARFAVSADPANSAGPSFSALAPYRPPGTENTASVNFPSGRMVFPTSHSNVSAPQTAYIIFTNAAGQIWRIGQDVGLGSGEPTSCSPVRWPGSLRVFEGSSAYSDLVAINDDGMYGVLFERIGYGTITFSPFHINDVLPPSSLAARDQWVIQ